MPKKKQLTQTQWGLSRLKAKDLPLIAINGLTDPDPTSPESFGSNPKDIIEYHVYDTNDNYIASGEISEIPTNLDVGAHVRSLGYERGTYKIVYNFLRQIGGSSKFVLTKKSDKSIWDGLHLIEPDGRIIAAQLVQDALVPLMVGGKAIELLLQEDKFWIQEISPSRTEIRLRPNPAIDDPDYYEQFRILGYTCLSYSDISGGSEVTLASGVATITGNGVNLNNKMAGGTLKIREAFVIDEDEIPEVISRFVPEVELQTFPPANNLVNNGDFFDGINALEKASDSGNHEVVEDILNPGNSKWCLKTTSADKNNNYELLLNGIPGESYIMSCWVSWEEQIWPSDRHGLFRGKWDVGGNLQDIPDTEPVGDIILETKIIDGRQWHKVYRIKTIPEDSNGTVRWYLGKTPSGNTTTGTRYITDVQMEPGALGGTPSPFMKEERPEETDFPTTGLVTFTDDNKIEASFSEDDSGFTDLMAAGSGGRGSGILTIKDAYVVDEIFTQDTEVTVIDDIPLKNSLATDIAKYEREFRVSPYHGQDQNNKIILQVDNAYDLYSVNSSGGETLLGSGTDWRTAEEFLIPGSAVGLRVNARNGGGPGAIIAKVWFNGDVVKTGDGRSSFDFEHWTHRWMRDGFSSGTDIPSITRRFTTSTGPWNIIDFTDNAGNVTTATTTDPISWMKKADAGKGPWGSHVHPDLSDCEWIWSVQNTGYEVINWNWIGGSSITDLIWQYWDPDLHSDAVKPEGWGEGFNSFNWGGNEDRKNDRSRWHTGWLGHHAKWVEGEGQYGETCMKFIDKNTQFGAPNHIDYNGIHKTGNVPTTSDQPTTLAHRWMGISQTLPHKMAAQGLEAGDKITISWWQKSDTANKGAMVGLYHYKISDGNTTWGPWAGTHPSTIGDDENGEPMLEAGEREFLRYRPISKVGEWEQVSYTAEVEDDWDMTKPTSLYVYGHYGPEGILWVESPTVQLTEATSKVNRTPVTADLVAEIDTFVGKNTLTLKESYGDLAPDNIVSDNATNIRSFNEFTEFYVDYTSSLYSATPIYGSFRGDIESINLTDNEITLMDGNSYQELGEVAGHDFEKYPLAVMEPFNKWFIQYPQDKSEDLSKLVRLGQKNSFNLITNFKIDTTTYPDYPYSVVYKLYEPLPGSVQEHDFVTIVKELIPPVEETCTLVPFIEEWISDIVLRTPEFQSVTSPIGAGQTKYKTYDQLTSTDASIKESIENEVLSGSLSADINVDHNQFSNFIHFGSIEKRLRNFKYKLDQVEQYTDRSASLAGTNSGSIGEPVGRLSVKADPGAGGYLSVSGSEDPHPPFTPVSGSLTQIQSWEKKRREVINNFDKFEKYMFNQSSSYSSESIGIFHDNAWPKESGNGTYSNPYVLYRTSQSAATTWYSEQLVSASDYDKANKNRVRSHLPMFVQDDDENAVFLNFIDMIGHYFDDIWVFIKAMTDVHDKRDKLTEGIAKDLLHPVAQSLGWEVFDGKDLISIPRYMFGMEQTGSERPWQFSGTSDRDISREIWSRIVNNMPYFLKTKGTSRAIKGLISCYGIPSSILRVLEYGGPKLPSTKSDFMITRKFTKALDFFGASNNTYVQNDTWERVTLGEGATNRVPDTVEFRFRAVTGSNQVLVSRGTDWAIRLKDNGSIDNRGHVSFMLNGLGGYLETSSSNFPVYDGEFWSVMLTRTLSGSGAFLASDATNQDVVYSLYTKKYDAGRSKIIYESTNTLLITGSDGSINTPTYNASYVGTTDTITIGGPEHATFGESLSGSMMEYRNWTTPLNEDSFDNHVAAPIAFDGNTPSASWYDLVTRYSFDDDKDLSVSYNQWFQDVSADQSFTSSAVPHNYTSIMGDHFSSVVDETKMKVPNLGPSMKSSNKIRIEADTRIDKFGSPVLSFSDSITTPAYDTAPIDSNKLGIYFSPSKAIDEDIISSMPNLDFDQYIGDPRDQYKEQYTGLVTARNLYWQKYSGPNNFWDYLRLLKYYDSSLYKQIHTLVPARANATVGIVIEPTILERDKIIIGKKPTFETQHHTTFIETMGYISESGAYQIYEDNMNWSNPFGINKESMTSGSYMSASALYEQYEIKLNFLNEFETNWYTQQSGSRQPRGLISASALDVTPEMINTMPINLYDPFRLNNRTQETGSGTTISADFSSLNAPSTTFAENAAGTGSFVLKHILERPAIYNVGDRDTSGWYGSDYYNSTIQAGSVKAIFEEVVQPRVQQNVLSRNNMETEYYYSSSLSASLHKPYSSSFVLSDLDNRWDESVGTDRLFYLGCVQTGETTISDPGGRWDDNTPAVFVEMVSPTMLVTTDKPTTKMDAVNK